MISRLATGLRYLLSTLHERCCHRPCKTRFRLAGSAFSGRASNPLGHDERFLTTFILLSRTYPDASWAHGRRKFFDLARLSKAPIAVEEVKHINVLFAIEREINRLAPQERLRVRRERSCHLIVELEGRLREQRAKLSRNNDPTKAINYCLSRGTLSPASSTTGAYACRTTLPNASYGPSP